MLSNAIVEQLWANRRRFDELGTGTTSLALVDASELMPLALPLGDGKASTMSGWGVLPVTDAYYEL